MGVGGSGSNVTYTLSKLVMPTPPSPPPTASPAAMNNSIRAWGAEGLGGGTPVMDPPGNAACTHSTALTPCRRCPRTVLTSWCTVAKDSNTISCGTCTLPTSHTCTPTQHPRAGSGFAGPREVG
eukprot:587-Prorocentrum_minimum.AAC.7